MTPDKDENFETFQESPRPPANIPMVTINRSGNFVFNKLFRNKYWQELEHSYVLLQYDRMNQIIRLKQRLDPEPNAYRIRDLDRMLIVSGKAFLKHFEIPFEKSRSYAVDVQKDEEGYTYIHIDLKQSKPEFEGKKLKGKCQKKAET